MTLCEGLFSVLPAYLADVFGEKHVGAIHGRVLTAWSTAALVGPNMITYLRKTSHDDAVRDLVEVTTDSAFLESFGTSKDNIQQLVDAKTVTIPRLMEIVPVGVVDPTPTLYASSAYGIAGLLTLAMICNIMIKPVDPKHHIVEKQLKELDEKELDDRPKQG